MASLSAGRYVAVDMLSTDFGELTSDMSFYFYRPDRLFYNLPDGEVLYVNGHFPPLTEADPRDQYPASTPMSEVAILDSWYLSAAMTFGELFTADTIDDLIGPGEGRYASGSFYSDRLAGAELSDSLWGNEGNDSLLGRGGNDQLVGDVGNDKLFGEAGDDILDGGVGTDYLSGGSGSDEATYISSATGLKVSLATPRVNTGDAAGDTYNSIENLTGSGFNDTLTGSDGANRILGVDGNDNINGLKGNDVILAGGGNDRIYGHLGSDSLEGGGGRDTFIFHTALGATNVDRIWDFDTGNDKIELHRSIFTNLSAGALNPDFFKDNATGVRDADDRIIYNSNTGSLFYDADGLGGNPAVRFAILSYQAQIDASDFVVV